MKPPVVKFLRYTQDSWIQVLALGFDLVVGTCRKSEEERDRNLPSTGTLSFSTFLYMINRYMMMMMIADRYTD